MEWPAKEGPPGLDVTAEFSHILLSSNLFEANGENPGLPLNLDACHECLKDSCTDNVKVYDLY